MAKNLYNHSPKKKDTRRSTKDIPEFYGYYSIKKEYLFLTNEEGRINREIKNCRDAIMVFGENLGEIIEKIREECEKKDISFPKSLEIKKKEKKK